MWQSYKEITLVSVWISESWALTMVFVVGILITCTNRSGAGASLRCRRSDAHWWRTSRSPQSWSPVARCGQAYSLKKSPPLLGRHGEGQEEGEQGQEQGGGVFIFLVWFLFCYPFNFHCWFCCSWRSGGNVRRRSIGCSTRLRLLLTGRLGVTKSYFSFHLIIFSPTWRMTKY